MGDTTIQWTDKTWPVLAGCTRVSEGCRNCYSERLTATRLKNVPAYQGLATMKHGDPRWTGEVRINEKVLRDPLRWKKPCRIFVSQMSDLFHEAVPHGFIVSVFSHMEAAPQHTFQILTKRPESMLNHFRGGLSDKFPVLPNVHLGVSVEDQETANERIPLLLQTPAAVRFISAEPLLGSIVLNQWLGSWTGKQSGLPSPLSNALESLPDINGIDWVICGGESGPKARPMHPDWARSVRDQCVTAGVPFFFKQWGEWFPVCAQYPENEAEEEEAEEASLCGEICMSSDGYIWEDNVQPSVKGRPWLMDRVGKKAAGSLLDGKQWLEFPR